MINITILEKYHSLIPALKESEYKQLEESIKENGQWIPILVNSAGVILDGHNRYKICKELKINPKVVIKSFDNELLEKKFVIECNLKRRQLNDFQKSELGIPLQKINAKLAKIRQSNVGNPRDEPLASNEANGQKSANQTASEIGVSRGTFERAKKIIEKAPEDLKQKVREGKTSISYAYKTVNRQDKKAKAQPIPTGQFDVILADPPWKYDIDTRGSPDDHYDIMDDNAINNLKIPSAENCVLFLWGTAPKLVEALQVMKAWGFEYKTNMVWIKDKIGTGYYFRGKHEFLLVGIKGKPLIPEETDRPESVLIAPRTKHSKKPEEIYAIIEKMYPDAKYLELFARNTKKNWTSWGDEIT